MAALCYQLPRDSRTYRAIDPTYANSTDTYLLRQVELNQRRWAWAHTKDAESKVNEPAPIVLPGEREMVEEREKRAELDAAAVAAAFNIGP